MERVEERLDTEAVASGEEGAVSLIPEDEGELAAQAMKTLGTEILIEVQGDFTIGASAQVMPGLFQFALDGFVAVELAIDDDVNAAIFAGDGLVAGGESIMLRRACPKATFWSGEIQWRCPSGPRW